MELKNGRESRSVRWARLSVQAMFVLVAWGAAASSSAQPGLNVFGQFPGGGFPEPGSVSPGGSLPPVQVVAATAASRRKLAQAEGLLREGLWDEALDFIDELASGADAGLVELEEDLFVPLPARCQHLLASLPAEGLAAYRERGDATAKVWLDEALAGRDLAGLQRVADSALATSHSGAALGAMADLLLEQGEYEAARDALRRITPLAVGPSGRDIEQELRGIDLAKHGQEVAQIWLSAERPARFNRIPIPAEQPQADQPILSPEQVFCRLVIASIRELDFERAAREIELLNTIWPDATGTIAGREGILGELLEAILQSARGWPDPQAALAFTVPSPLGVHWEQTIDPGQPSDPTRPPGPSPARPPFFFQGPGMQGIQTMPNRNRNPRASAATVVGDIAVIRAGSKLFGLKLATGERAISRTGLLFEDPDTEVSPPVAGRQNARILGGQDPRFMLQLGIQANRMNLGFASVFRNVAPPTALGSIVYLQTPTGGEADRLIGIDLARDAALDFSADPPPEQAFAGPPCPAGERLVVATVGVGVRREIGVACYARSNGRLLWRRPLCVAPLSDSGVVGPIGVTVREGLCFVNTGVGAVAAVDVHNGTCRWLRRYARTPRPLRSVATLFVGRGAVFAAPEDGQDLFALDGFTGETLWQRPRGSEDCTLLGVVEGVLCAAGEHAYGYDVHTGRLRYRWPEGERPGLRGRSAGCLAGREVFWPTSVGLYTLDALTGAPTCEPRPFQFAEGAQLIPSRAGLLVVDGDRVELLGPNPPAPKRTQPPLAEGPRIPSNSLPLRIAGG